MNIINNSSNSYNLETTSSNIEWEQLIKNWISYSDLQSPETIKTYLTSIRQFFSYVGQNNISSPTREDVISWREQLIQESKSSSTINTYLISCRKFFDYLKGQKIYPNIFKNVKGKKISKLHKKDNLTSSQASELISSIERDTLQGKRNYAIISLMISCGLRDIEVSRANIDDMRPVGDRMGLFIQGKGHSEKDDFVVLPSRIEYIIREYLSNREDEYDYDSPLFISTSNRSLNKRLSTRSISKVVKTSLRNIGLNSNRLTAHSLRHTAATLNLLNGGTLEQTQNLLRHENISTTMIYSHHIETASNDSTERIADLIFK